MRVTVCELTLAGESEQEWARLCRHVAVRRPALVVLPEMPFAPWFSAEERFDQATWKAAIAAHDHWAGRLGELGTAVIGSRPVDRGGRRRNEGFAFTPDHGYVAVHDKAHLPEEAGYWEARWYEPGAGAFAAVPVGGLRVGMLICSDLWVMDHARGFARDRVELVVNPRATPTASAERWLLGARVAGILAGAFFASSNHRDDALGMGGGAWVTGPEGEVLATTAASTPIVTVDVDARRARAAKATYPRYL